MHDDYTKINSLTVDKWVEEGWQWGKPITHEEFINAKNGDWEVFLTPTKPVPRNWFLKFNNLKILGLASGGAQQMPIFSALGAKCTVLDYSQKQLDSEEAMAIKEGYNIELVKADMSKKLPFDDETFDLIFHPVSNCYVEDVYHVWRECYRVLKKGGVILSGVDNGLNYAFNEEETTLDKPLPFNPLKDKELYEESIKSNSGIQFSHTIDEQIGGQLKAGFVLIDIFGDTNGQGILHEHNIDTFWAIRSIKK